MKYLLDLGLSLNLKQLDGSTAVHIAASKGNISLVELLLSRGADTTAVTKYGRTVLHEAVFNGNVKVGRYIYFSVNRFYS